MEKVHFESVNFVFSLNNYDRKCLNESSTLRSVSKLLFSTFREVGYLICSNILKSLTFACINSFLQRVEWHRLINHIFWFISFRAVRYWLPQTLLLSSIGFTSTKLRQNYENHFTFQNFFGRSTEQTRPLGIANEYFVVAIMIRYTFEVYYLKLNTIISMIWPLIDPLKHCLSSRDFSTAQKYFFLIYSFQDSSKNIRCNL